MNGGRFFRKMREWPVVSVKMRLFLGFVALFSLLSALFVWLLVRHEHRFLMDQNLAKTEGRARNLAINSEPWILSGDLAGMRELVNALRQFPDLGYAFLLTGDGRVLAHTDSSKVGLYVEDPLSLTLIRGKPEMRVVRRDDTLIEVAMPIAAGDTVIGWARVATDQRLLRENLQRIKRTGVLFVFAAACAGCLAALYIANALTRGLERLISASRRLEGGDMGARAGLPRDRSEIGRLGASFDSMASTLEKRYREKEAAERELRAMADELRRRGAELEQFTYTVSHDLKSPLVTIKTFLGYLENDLESGDAAYIAKDLDFIRSAADKMGLLLEDLLEMSRIGRVVNEPVEVTFREVADEALKAVAGPVSLRNAEILVADADLTLFGDRPRLVEIWQNLVENAVKYHGSQGRPRIEIGFQSDGYPPVFFVRDNGIGIEPRYAEKVFGLFEKLDRESEGSGLGLALVKRIVEHYDGRVWLESAGEGKGTTFFFTLPKAVKREDITDAVEEGEAT